MIPKHIHQVHIGQPPSGKVQRWMDTVRAVHPDWQYTLWTENNIPSLGIDLRHLIHVFPKAAGVSNAVRIKAVMDHGGIYLDTDVECLKPMDSFLEHEAFAAFQDYVPDDITKQFFCNAVFGSVAGHPWLQWQWEHTSDWHKIAAHWGVDLMSQAPRDGVTAIPTHLVYPFLWTTPKEQRVVHPESICVHHWLGSWCDKSMK